MNIKWHWIVWHVTLWLGEALIITGLVLLLPADVTRAVSAALLFLTFTAFVAVWVAATGALIYLIRLREKKAHALES